MIPRRTGLLWLNLICVLHIGKSALDTSNWMSNNIFWLGKLKLKELCMAGSHNSGMNQITGGTPNAKGCKILNQNLTVRAQLEKGVRYLDVRPVLSKGQFMAGNYYQMENGQWEGATGQSIESIIEDLNNFTREHNELIIINLSQTLNTDVEEYRLFNQDDWNKLLDLLNSTENLYHAPATVSLQKITLGQITENGTKAGVFYIVYDRGTGVELGELTGKGYFYPTNIHIFQSEPDTDDPLAMLEDQLWLMENVSPNRYFILNFILVQTPGKITACSKKRNNIMLAQKANSHLQDIIHYVTDVINPNVISVDYVGESGAPEVAMSINLRWLSKHALASLNKGR